MSGKYRVKIIPPNFFSFLRFKKRFYGFSGVYHYHLDIFDSFPMFLLFTVLIGSIAYQSSSTFLYSLSISIALYIIATLIVLKRKISKFKITRSIKSLVFENDTVSVTYKVYNPTSFKLENLFFVDIFEATEKGHITFEIESINPNTVFQKTVDVTLNTGMGIKKIGPIVTSVSDPLNIFSYRIEYKAHKEINVLPRVKDLPALDKIKDVHSSFGGKYNIQARGDSSNFIGTKEYVAGEPIKRINWKLSLKQHKIILNEYEKDTNAKVLIILDLDKVKHFGKGAYSTWEYMKDICLSITNIHNHSGNFVSVISQDFFIPYQVGSGHLELIERTVISQKLSNNKDFKYSLEKIIDRDTNVFYISSFIQAMRSVDDYEILRKASAFNSINLILIDPFDYYIKEGHKDHLVLLSSLQEITNEKLLPFLKENMKDSFQHDIIKINKDHSYENQFQRNIR